MTQFTNMHSIDLSLAVWLVHDDYDFLPKERAISATALRKPTKQIILGSRITTEAVEDISTRISLRLGHAIHDSIEHAWTKGYKTNLRLLGLPDSAIDRVKINPKPEEVQPDTIPVWLERRGTRKLGPWTISGKMDMSLNYRLKDVKSTSVYTYLLGRKDLDYTMQGSFYKWIHPDKVKDDEMDVQFVFTDWQKALINSTPGYPQTRLVSYSVPLLSEAETELWIENKLEDLVRHENAPQDQLPRCTDDDLWRSKAVWKYYSDPMKTDGKATKNFSDPAEANRHRAEKGKGVVIHVPGKVKACLYCRAFEICDQRKEYSFDD